MAKLSVLGLTKKVKAIVRMGVQDDPQVNEVLQEAIKGLNRIKAERAES